MSCPRAQWPASSAVACAAVVDLPYLAFEDKPLDFKAGLRPFDPHRADVLGGGIVLLFYARRGVEHGANKDEGDGGELLGQGGEACDGDSPSLFQRPAAPVDEVRGGHCRA